MITDRLIHIHTYRCGGFLIRAVLREIPGLQIINDHLHVPYERMARIANDVLGRIPPAIVFTRNPYAWYVSMWGVVWQNPNVPFVGTFREFMEGIGQIQDANFVTFTQNWNNLGADNAIRCLEFEKLREDLYFWLDGIVDDLLPEQPSVGIYDSQLWRIINTQPRFHPSLEWPSRQRTRHYSHYYDKDTRRMVEEWDGELIERFGYEFQRP